MKTFPSLWFTEIAYLLSLIILQKQYIQELLFYTGVCWMSTQPQAQPVVLILLKFLQRFGLSCRDWDLEELRTKWESRRRLDLCPPGLRLSHHTPQCLYDKWHTGFSSVLSLSITHWNIRLRALLLFSAAISTALHSGLYLFLLKLIVLGYTTNFTLWKSVMYRHKAGKENVLLCVKQHVYWWNFKHFHISTLSKHSRFIK